MFSVISFGGFSPLSSGFGSLWVFGWFTGTTCFRHIFPYHRYPCFCIPLMTFRDSLSDRAISVPTIKRCFQPSKYSGSVFIRPGPNLLRKNISAALVGLIFLIFLIFTSFFCRARLRADTLHSSEIFIILII